MKYIKKFNEELNPNTYMKVSKSLKDLKHNKRADRLEKHARIISQLNKLNDLANIYNQSLSRNNSIYSTTSAPSNTSPPPKAFAVGGPPPSQIFHVPGCTRITPSASMSASTPNFKSFSVIG